MMIGTADYATNIGKNKSTKPENKFSTFDKLKYKEESITFANRKSIKHTSNDA
jgi:hypothetical protein